eukprot:CAMPEP_0197444620 /NCGR_PEP_ID=MMETSP1175-20131217/10059_1 /TAXON_ID=1003142 /ORGANISM="Triceratium dubium, Strain CCMP147" /LENGTH=523 /DNA_ID=CAMNT_0042975439 /DNA_START=103 /DNA_END=1674 /DNA_ORIENTATION=-
MATEDGEDIMEELTTGTTELTERTVMRAARMVSAAAGNVFEVHEKVRQNQEGAIPLLPPWINALPSTVNSFLIDYLGVHWPARLIVLVCVVVVPAAMVGGALWGRIFRLRREEVRGLIDRKTSGFSQIDGLGTEEDENGWGEDVEHQEWANKPSFGPGSRNITNNLKKAKPFTTTETRPRIRTNAQDLPFRPRGKHTKKQAAAATEPKGAKSVTLEQKFHKLNITMTQTDENPPPTAAATDAALGAPKDAPAKEEADDSTAGDTDAATGVCDDTFKTGEDDEDEDLEDAELEAAPLHLHTLRVPARLRGSGTPIGVRSRSSSRSRSNSRDVSPSPASKAGSDKGSGGKHRRTSSRESDKVPSLVPGTETSGGTVSSGSSVVDSEIDPDILLDRAGFEELEPPPPHEISMGPLASPGMQGGHGSGLLSSVNERMSEETLDDCHAFTDLAGALHQSLRSLREGETGDDGKGKLEPLQEEDKEEDDNDDNGLTMEERSKLIKKQKDLEAKKRQEEEAEKAKAKAAS